MVPKSLRQGSSATTAHRRSGPAVRLRCDQLEGRIAPALFDVLEQPLTFTGLNNNGCVAVADLNKDGFQDAVLTNFGLNYASLAGTTITVLYGQDGGGFNRAQFNTNGQNVSFVSIADVNGDTWLDVVATNANRQNTGSVAVFQNDQAGNLSLFGTPFSTFSYNPSWVGLHDVTGDGVLDAVVGSFGRDDGSGEDLEGNNVTIFQGNGDFTFSGSPITTLAPEIQFIPTALAVADFDGDGLKDIAATSPGVPLDFGQPQPNGSIYMFRGTGAGGFAAPNQFESGGALPLNIQAAYLNGDTKPDLVVANAGDPNASPEFSNDAVGVLLNVSSSGNVNFGVPNSLTTNTLGTFAVAAADFDLDGKTDIAAVNYGSQALSPPAFVSVYTGNGSGTFTPGSPGTYDTQTGLGGGQYLAVGDFDTNGTPDLIVAHATNRVGMLFNTSVAPVTTTTALASSLNPSVSGQAVTFTATVTAAAGTATGGTVTFFRNGVALGSPVTLTNQQAQLTVSTLAVGNHAITATYTGAAGFGGSATPTPLTQVVNPAGPTPTVTINQGPSQPDPTNTPSVTFDVHFDQAMTGFTGSDVQFTGSTVGGTLVAGVSGSGQDYTVTVTGMTGTGTVVASLPAGAAVNATGIGNAASTSTDNTVTFDGTPPSVTINQAAGQADPTNVGSIQFDVRFSEPVSGFGPADVSLTGSTAGGTLTVNVTGSLDTYTVTVTGMTTGGSVIATVPAGAATDAVGNPTLASTSTDNSVEFRNTGTLGFSQAVFDTTEDGTAHTVTVTVSRTGAADGAVSIAYATADGTARTDGQANRGRADYTPTTGTLSWEAGEAGDKTFTVTVQPDVLNEGRELINLALTDAVGSPVLGLTEAVVAIKPSDGQGPGVTFDEDNDKVTIKLAGRTGTLLFFRTDPDGDGRGPIELIELTGTLPNPLKPKAALVISVTKAKLTTTDGGTVNLGAITGSGLKSISARKANLNLEGINLTGFLGALTIGNVVAGADITTGPGAPERPRQRTRINALAIGDETVPADETVLNIRAGVSSLTATSFRASSLTAPIVGAMTIKGDMTGDVTISGEKLNAYGRSLGKLRVKGNVVDSDIMVTAGHVGSVVVGTFWGSRLFAGYAGPDIADPAGFNVPATVNTFRTTGLFSAFENSRVIATAIKSVSLTSLDSDNDENEFGFYADQSLGTINLVGRQKFRFGINTTPPQFIEDFAMVVV